MTIVWSLLGSLMLFLVGLRLSFFFSGSETGFYRLNLLRLNFDANRNDTIARGLVWFSHHPSHFVATTLVGNNIANYLTTLALGLLGASLLPQSSGWVEIVFTLLISPVIFIFGELIPKSLYYRSPTRLLRREYKIFRIIYYLVLPVTLPLIGLTKLLQKFGNTAQRQYQLVLGRSRLVQVLSEGHREGLLHDAQGKLIQGVLSSAGQSVTRSMTPAARVLGLPMNSPRKEMLDYARKFGINYLVLSREGKPNDWFAYVRVGDLIVDPRPLSNLIQQMPIIRPESNKLEALLVLRRAGKKLGLVSAEKEILGVASDRGLIEQLFRPPISTPAQ